LPAIEVTGGKNLAISTRAATLKQEMCAALSKELEIARKASSGERANEVKDGVQTRKKGNSFVYEFEELTGYPPDEGVQVSFTVGEKTSKGRYLGEINSKFVFEFDDDLGANITHGAIVSDPLFLLEKQISILSTDGPFESQVALSSIGLAEYLNVNSLSPNKSFMDGLNQLQTDALEVVAKNSVTYIWGPPGTGKTTTMGSIVAALASLGQKVLLVSNTNLAIDTALERCLDRFSDVKELSGGEMLRLGTMVKPELIKKYSSKIDLDNLFEKEVVPLRKKIETLSSSLSKKKNKISDLLETQREYDRHLEKSLGSAKAEVKVNALREDLNKAKKEIPALNSRIAELEQEFTQANSKSGIGRMFSKSRNPGAIRLDINSAQSKKNQADKAVLRISSEIPILEKEIAEIDRAAAASKAWLAKHSEGPKLIIEIDSLKSETAVDEKAIEALQEEISQKRTAIMQNAMVIACTAYKPLLDKEIIAMKFDCVVIDEASMMQLPLYYCAAALAQTRIVIAGDFRQLPPIVRVGSNSSRGDSPAAALEADMKALMTENAFTKSGVIAKSKIGEKSTELIALRDQYRMRQPISDLISETFYPEHTLRTVAEKTDKPTPWGNEAFIFFDTTSLEPESSTVGGKSRRNLMHALTIQAIAEQLFEDGWELKSTAKKSFGIITPYAKQSSFIESLLTTDPDKHVKGGISTVHRFQGNERDLMIIDLTKVASDNEPNLGSFIGHPDPLAPENAMWNVAISRARQHVMIVGDSPTLERNSSALISQLVTKMKKNMKVIDARTVINEELLLASKTKPTSTSGSISWFTGEGFYKAFEKDLRSVKSKVFLASPFTTAQGTDRWMQTFRDLRAKEVEIIGFTKPINEKDASTNSAEIHTGLEGVFKELRPVSKMHEKLAVFDQRVVWLGSLNILSHKNSTEIMVRIDSPDFAQSIIEEYQNQRVNKGRPAKVYAAGKHPKIGDKCDRPGCGGKFAFRPAGISKNSGRAYSAFLSCDNWRINKCDNSAPFVAES
jgi:superfamily I DNA and/or RNA helicase